MAQAAQKSIQNAKGKYLQEAAEGEAATWGGMKGAAVGSGAAMNARRKEYGTEHGKLTVVEAPAAAVQRVTKASKPAKDVAASKAQAAKPRAKKPAAATA